MTTTRDQLIALFADVVLDGDYVCHHDCTYRPTVEEARTVGAALADELFKPQGVGILMNAEPITWEFSTDALKLANEIVRLHRVIDEKIADLDEAAEHDEALLAALDCAGVTVEACGGGALEITVHRDGPLSAPGLRAAADTMQLLGRPLYANELRVKAEQVEAEAAGS